MPAEPPPAWRVVAAVVALAAIVRLFFYAGFFGSDEVTYVASAYRLLEGDWTVRAEYIGQFGDGHPSDAVGVQRQYDLYPAMNIGTLVIGYELKF